MTIKYLQKSYLLNHQNFDFISSNIRYIHDFKSFLEYDNQTRAD